jgi:N utilization substance protein B
VSRIFEGRTRARSQAVQLLFQANFQQKDVYDLLESGSYVLDDESDTDEPAPAMAYAQELARGVAKRQVAIDRLISSVSDNWNLSRMPLVDRMIMSIAIFEMFEEDDIPVAVAVSEAVEISKVYGTEDSSSFVNGILGRIARLAQAHPDVEYWKLAEFAGESPEQTRAAALAHASAVEENAGQGADEGSAEPEDEPGAAQEGSGPLPENLNADAFNGKDA